MRGLIVGISVAVVVVVAVGIALAIYFTSRGSFGKCSCDNGTPANNCASSSMQGCVSCNTGYTLENNQCVGSCHANPKAQILTTDIDFFAVNNNMAYGNGWTGAQPSYTCPKGSLFLKDNLGSSENAYCGKDGATYCDVASCTGDQAFQQLCQI